MLLTLMLIVGAIWFASWLFYVSYKTGRLASNLLYVFLFILAIPIVGFFLLFLFGIVISGC